MYNDLFFKKEKIKKINNTAPNKSDLLNAKNDGYKLGKKWNAYSREVRIHLHTNNFDELVRFYNKILELPIVGRFRSSNSHGVLIDIGGNIIEIFSKTDKSKFNGKISLSLRVKDVEKQYEKYSSKNIAIGKLTKNDWNDTSFDIIDPDGNKIYFFSIDIPKERYYKIKYNKK